MGDVFDPGCEDRPFPSPSVFDFPPSFDALRAALLLDSMRNPLPGFWYIQEGRNCGGLLSLPGWRRFLGSGIGNAGLISEYYIAFSCDVEEVRSSGEHLNFLPGR